MNRNGYVYIASFLNYNEARRFLATVGLTRRNFLQSLNKRDERELLHDIKGHRSGRNFVQQVHDPVIHNHLSRYFVTKQLYPADVHNLTNAQLVNIVRQIRRGRAMGNVHFFRHTLPRTLYKNSKWWF